jgi:hypothetical protein
MKAKLIFFVITLILASIAGYIHYLTGGIDNLSFSFLMYAIMLIIGGILIIANDIINKRELKKIAKFHQNIFEIEHDLPISK